MTERDLIGQARRGDAPAWDQLMAVHQEAAFRLAYLILGESQEAEDAAQDAFIRAYRALARFDLERPFRPWILSIVTNVARNRLRSGARYLAALQRLVRLEPTGGARPDGGLARDFALKDRSQTLWQAVRRLASADQEIVYLRYFLEMTEAETAATLGVPPGTVKSRLHRALNRLRAVVENEFPALREMIQE